MVRFPGEAVSAEDFIRSYKEASLQAQAAVSETQVVRLIEMLGEARDEDRQIFICGNGGSAAMASHMAGELGKEASWDRPKRFRVRSLTDNVVWMTAIANDAEYASIFVEQLRNCAQRGDLLIAFSTSGNSPNVVRAVQWAAQAGLKTAAVVGGSGGRLRNLADLVLSVESAHTGRIQEGHFLIQHLVSYFFIEQ